MSRKSQRHRSRSLPFRHLDGGLQFELEEYSIDGRPVEEVDLPPGQSTLDVSPSGGPGGSSGASWNWATLFGRIEVPDTVPSHVFPPEERDAPPAKLEIAVRCHETIYRDGVTIEEAPVTPGEYEVQIRLDWDDFRGTVELFPYLARTEESESEGPYATTRYAKVANGNRYYVVVDHRDADEPPTIDGEEASFSRSDHLPDEEKLYYLDFRNKARPKLWINSDHPRIADVLRSEGSVGAEPRMRDVILDQVGYGVWSQLIVRSAVAIGPNGDVDYEWQQTVLEAFAPELYGVDDVEDAKQLLRDDVDDPEQIARLVSRIDGELQDFLDPRSQLIHLMEEGLQI